jgi:transketolase
MIPTVCGDALAPEAVSELQRLCGECRKLIINTTAHAGCGHTGGSLSEVEILVALYFKVMRIDPQNHRWAERDRFILSKGHATPGYYAILAMRGFFPVEMLGEFDKINSHLQGHPCMNKTVGVDMSTGSLGQGLSAGIGMALGRDRRKWGFTVYVLLGDGEIQEGQIWEAAMYAGFHQVKGLVAILDYNRVQLAGKVPETLDVEPLADKWKAFRWQVKECDGHDMAQVVQTLEGAKALSWASGPVVVIAHTVKGKGVSFMEHQFKWHGRAPNAEERVQALAEIEPRGESS